MLQDDRTHFLLAGDTTDIDALRGIVSCLPEDAYGQVLVEVASLAQAEDWDLPAGMSLTWPARDRSIAIFGGMPARGELVARAVLAWVAEWMPERQQEGSRPAVLGIGCSASGQVDRLYRHLATTIEHLHLHHPHHEQP